jgi:hypothetical protein
VPYQIGISVKKIKLDKKKKKKETLTKSNLLFLTKRNAKHHTQTITLHHRIVVDSFTIAASPFLSPSPHLYFLNRCFLHRTVEFLQLQIANSVLNPKLVPN